MGETAWHHCEGPNHIKAPAGKRPGWRYGDETAGRDMRLFGKELAVLASPHEVLSVEHCSGPPETSFVCFPLPAFLKLRGCCKCLHVFPAICRSRPLL
jgi:hypothetical protein